MYVFPEVTDYTQITQIIKANSTEHERFSSKSSVTMLSSPEINTIKKIIRRIPNKNETFGRIEVYIKDNYIVIYLWKNVI